MTILVLSQVFPPRTGGSGRWLWELYRRLRGVTVHVAAGQVDGDAEFDRTASLPIDRIHLDFPSWGFLGPRAAWHYVRGLTALARIVRRVSPDVLHCGKCLPEGMLAVALKYARRLPFCVYAHGEELTLAKTSRELALLTRLVLREATTVIANSRNSREILLNDWAVPDTKIVVLHPGVDTARFAPAPVDPEVRRRLGWTGRRVVLTVGALQKRKGQDMMIRALPAIRAKCPDVLYAIAGVGVERPYLEALVAEHGVGDVVQFCGVPPEQELVSYYQQCDLFALPNRRVGWDLEGFGIVSLEAQACGKAVIVGDSGGAPETVQPKITGEVVACETPAALALAVVELLNDSGLRASMGISGQRWVVEHFDWAALAADADSLFAQVSGV